MTSLSGPDYLSKRDDLSKKDYLSKKDDLSKRDDETFSEFWARTERPSEATSRVVAIVRDKTGSMRDSSTVG